MSATDYRFDANLTEAVNKWTDGRTVQWLAVVAHMQAIGHNGCTESQLRTRMNRLIDTYFDVLVDSDNYRKACLRWPLFEYLNHMNLRPFIGTLEAYLSVEHLRSKLDYSLPPIDLIQDQSKPALPVLRKPAIDTSRAQIEIDIMAASSDEIPIIQTSDDMLTSEDVLRKPRINSSGDQPDLEVPIESLVDIPVNKTRVEPKVKSSLRLNPVAEESVPLKVYDRPPNGSNRFGSITETIVEPLADPLVPSKKKSVPVKTRDRPSNTFKCIVDFEGQQFTIVFDDYTKPLIPFEKLAQRIETMIGSKVGGNTHHFRVICGQDIQQFTNFCRKNLKNGSKIEIKLRDNVYNKDDTNRKRRSFLQVMEASMARGGVNWDLVAKQMRKLGYKSMNPNDCQKEMHSLVSLYMQVLTFTDCFATGCRLWSLFAEVNAFDFKPFVPDHTYQSISKMKQRIGATVRPKKVSPELKIFDRKDGKKGHKIFNLCHNSQKIELTRGLAVEERQRLRSILVECVSERMPNIDWDSVTKTMHSKGLPNLNVFDFKAIFNDMITNFISFLSVVSERHAMRSDWRSFALIFDMNLKPFLKSTTHIKVLSLKQKLIAKRDQMLITNYYDKQYLAEEAESISGEDLEFVKVFAFVEDSEQLNTFLIEIIQESMSSGDVDWSQVATQLKAIKFVGKHNTIAAKMNANECQKYFKLVISRYVLVLSSADSISAATEMWPFFPVIHSIDLSRNLDSIVSENVNLLANKFPTEESEPEDEEIVDNLIDFTSGSDDTSVISVQSDESDEESDVE